MTEEPFPPKGSAHRAVLVKNLSPETKEDGLEDFFSFCGKITNIKVRESQHPSEEEQGQQLPPSKEAVVVFESRSAQQVALLLNNAVLNERHITVTKAPEDWNAVGATTQSQANLEETTQEQVPRSRSSMAEAFSESLRALADDVKDLNERHKILETAKELSAAAKEQASVARTKTSERFEELDAKYHIREKFADAADKGKGAALELNERLHISEYAKKVATAGREVARDIDSRFQVSEHASRLKQKAMENEGVQGFLSGVKSLSAKATDLYRSKFGSKGNSNAGDTSSSDHGEYELTETPANSSEEKNI
ncbi:Protein vip1 [Galdieria sulphuraria]|uniref:RNA recognition motif (RRM)-containing protein n=1 Tax=Galdieria sulphuraria TaxID=130081 RepID=M2WZZ1_GALSU|nr:RNA recognition motif (RRM)-containing protein [Galdieria sulphuraria]EME29650.1 RNA recognition motif (RRM)-containing protein [Galdieria sulphuraria]GJD12199.1 Protein vip1 [Galdieria sulphuraria]|eukprot:XP_005706170.1 RNA recognition motif (RRM)-containing protein [Galdieria sulphuraria]